MANGVTAAVCMQRLPRKLQLEENSVVQIGTGFKLQGGEKMGLLAALPGGKENGDMWILEDSWLNAPGLQTAGGREEIKQLIRRI